MTAFKLYDRDGDGGITASEFGSILKSLNVATHPKEIESIVASVDSNKDGSIDFDEFVVAMTKHMPGQPRQRQCRRGSSARVSFHEDDELLQCFQAFDKNNDGYISQKELEEVMSRLGENLTPQEIVDMMTEADTNKDGQIDFKEFKKLWPPAQA